RTLSRLAVEIGVHTGDDVERRARRSQNEGIQTQSPPRQRPCAAERKTVPNVKRRPAIFAAKIIRVNRKGRAALAIRVVVSVAQTIVAKETDGPAKTVIEADVNLVLIVSAA